MAHDNQFAWLLFEAGSQQTRKVEVDYWAVQSYPRPTALQHTAFAGLYWVTCADTDSTQTLIWRLDRRTMRMQDYNVASVAGIAVSTSNAWIDETCRRAYLIHDGHLFRVALPPALFEKPAAEKAP